SCSLYHAVRQQLQLCIPDDQLQIRMVNHIIQNQTHYADFLKNIDTDSKMLYIEDTIMQALMRSMNINIILFRCYEPSPRIYKRRDANQTIYLATDIDFSYYSFAVDDNENILNVMLADAVQDEVVVNPNRIVIDSEDE